MSVWLEHQIRKHLSDRKAVKTLYLVVELGGLRAQQKSAKVSLWVKINHIIYFNSTKDT